jgi:hypothetical protein
LGVIQAALDLERKIIAASFNPINALTIRACCGLPTPDRFNTWKMR